MEVLTFQLPTRFAPIVRLLPDEAPKQVDVSKALASVFLNLKVPTNAHVNILLGQGMPIELDTHVSALMNSRVSFYPMNTTSLFEIVKESGNRKSENDVSQAVIAIGREKIVVSPFLQVQEETAKRLLVDERVATSNTRPLNPMGTSHAGYVLQDEQGNFKLAGGPSRTSPKTSKGTERQSSWLIGGMLLTAKSSDPAHAFRSAVLAPDPRSFGGFEFTTLGSSARELTMQPAKRLWTTGMGVHLTHACLQALKQCGAVAATCEHIMPDGSSGTNAVASAMEMLVNSEPGDLLLDFSSTHVRGVFKC